MLNYVTGSKQVILVNDHDHELVSEDIFVAHRHPAQLHRASSVWLWRHNPETNELETLLQQRSEHKIVGATWWANAACGNVKPDESYEACAYRRLEGELNLKRDQLTTPLTPLYHFLYKAYCNDTYGEFEADQMFMGQLEKGTAHFNPNPEEVSNLAWLPVTKLFTWATSHPYPTLEETLASSTKDLKNSTIPLTFTHQNHSYVIAPWCILMLRDKRLHQAFSEMED